MVWERPESDTNAAEKREQERRAWTAQTLSGVVCRDAAHVCRARSLSEVAEETRAANRADLPQAWYQGDAPVD